MKKYKIIRRNMSIFSLLNQVVEDHDDHKNSYFWTPPSTASQRRAKEWDRSIEFSLNGVIYTVRQYVVNSCKNVRYNCYIEVGGYKKDIRAIKALL